MTFIQKAIGQGVAILFGATGEIVTEKSGNLNLGIPGIMYMGGISGLMGAFFYENGNFPTYVNSIAIGDDNDIYTVARFDHNGKKIDDLVKIFLDT